MSDIKLLTRRIHSDAERLEWGLYCVTGRIATATFHWADREWSIRFGTASPAIAVAIHDAISPEGLAKLLSKSRRFPRRRKRR